LVEHLDVGIRTGWTSDRFRTLEFLTEFDVEPQRSVCVRSCFRVRLLQSGRSTNGYLTTITVVGERRTTISATLPRRIRDTPSRPWLPMMIVSNSPSSTRLTIV